MRSPSRDPLERKRIEEARHREHELQQQHMREDMRHAHTTGRGGAGNISGRNDHDEEARGRGRENKDGPVSNVGLTTKMQYLTWRAEKTDRLCADLLFGRLFPRIFSLERHNRFCAHSPARGRERRTLGSATRPRPGPPVVPVKAWPELPAAPS